MSGRPLAAAARTGVRALVVLPVVAALAWVAGAQAPAPRIEQLRFTPDRLCLRGAFRWGFSYADLPGGLAAVTDVALVAQWQAPGEPPIQSALTPQLSDFALHTAERGTFESRLRHWGPPRLAPPGGIDVRYTLTLTLPGGQQATGSTVMRYEDRPCPPPPVVATLAAGQTGRVGFESPTPSTSEFLRGVTTAIPAVIWGDLALAPGGAARQPAVVLVHGSGGVGPSVERWAEDLAGEGLATFILDSFTGRGIAETADDQSRLSMLAMIKDAYRALELLATHPRVDPARIAVMGFSRGGFVALYASLRRFQRLHGPAGLEFAAYLPFYPPCGWRLLEDEDASARPIRLFHGAADDWTPVAPCRDYVARLRRVGKDVELREYAGAPHAFDVPRRTPLRFLTRVQNHSRCAVEEHPRGRLVEKTTGQPLGSQHACVSLGAHVGYDPQAHAEAVKAVRAVLKSAFRLGP